MEFKKVVSNNDNGDNQKEALELLEKIIIKLPPEINNLIEQAYIYKRVPKEYLLSSILFAFSNAAGLAFKLTHRSYENHANLYLALIGSRGDVKSEAMKLATLVLNENDDDEYDDYEKKKKDLNESVSSESEKVIIDRKQFLIQNATIEAAMFAHFKNPYSIGIFVDELSFLIDKIANKNNSEGMQWRTFLLQGNTNQHIDISRKTTDSYRIKKSYPTLLGSIQHQFIPTMLANGNLESGLVDRILFTTKLTNNNILSKSNMPKQVIDNYNSSLQSLLNYRKAIESENTSYEVLLSKEADERIHDYVQHLITNQSKLPDKEKEYNSKMQINIYKITLLLHLISNSISNSFQSKVSINTVDLAILINDFYFINFKIVIGSGKKPLIEEKLFREEIVKKAIKNGASQTNVIAVTGLSPGYVSKLFKRHTPIGNWKLETIVE